MRAPALAALVLAAMSHLMAADVSGAWTGAGLAITLKQHAQELSGTVATSDDTMPTPIENAQITGDTVTFEMHDGDHRVVKFRLKLADGALTGESSIGDRVSKIELSPADAGYYPIAGGMLGSQPIPIKRVEPEYTEEARAAGVRGTVVLQVQIDSSGRVAPAGIRVVRSLGFGLDQKAIEAARQWKFKPATKSGVPVAASATIEVSFRH